MHDATMMIHREKTYLRPLLAMTILVVIAGSGCSKNNSSGPDQKLSDEEYIALGWSEFEARQFDSAVNNFTAAYTSATSTALVRGEALNGRGWSYAYKRDLLMSRGDLVFAIALKGISAATLNDVRAGAAFVLYSMNDFPSAITYSSAALNDNPAYTFSHDAKVTTKRLRLLLVQSYYANGQFTSAASQMDTVDPARAPHSSDPSVLLASITTVLNSL